MTVFAKKIEDASDEELYSWINELDPNYTQLASDELTRRHIQKLTVSINKLNDNTEKYSRKLLDLTLLLFAVALIQVFVSIGTISRSWIDWILLVLVISWLVYFLIRSIKKPDKI